MRLRQRRRQGTPAQQQDDSHERRAPPQLRYVMASAGQSFSASPSAIFCFIRRMNRSAMARG